MADQLARDPQILPTVFSGQWDKTGNKWNPPDSAIHALVVFFQSILGLPNHDWQPPDGALLQDYITDNVYIEADRTNRWLQSPTEIENPLFAVKFLHALDRAVDNKLRDIALARANQYIDYLSDQLTKVTNTDVREALMTTLTDQENTKMMASVTAPYSAQTVRIAERVAPADVAKAVSCACRGLAYRRAARSSSRNMDATMAPVKSAT